MVVQRIENGPVLMRGVDQDAAGRARELIEARVDTGVGKGVVQGAAPSGASATDLLQKLTDLRDAGILSPEEFEAKKRDLRG